MSIFDRNRWFFRAQNEALGISYVLSDSRRDFEKGDIETWFFRLIFDQRGKIHSIQFFRRLIITGIALERNEKALTNSRVPTLKVTF